MCNHSCTWIGCGKIVTSRACKRLIPRTNYYPIPRRETCSAVENYIQPAATKKRTITNVRNTVTYRYSLQISTIPKRFRTNSRDAVWYYNAR
jgi:hypothetical protein